VSRYLTCLAPVARDLSQSRRCTSDYSIDLALATAPAGDAVDRDEQRLLQHRRKQFGNSFRVSLDIDSPFIPGHLTAKCAEAAWVGIS
jgi:hypothetical protein